METANNVAIDARALVLLDETGGRCQKCGRILGIKKEGNDINYAKIVRLSETDDIILCVDCEKRRGN